MSANGIMNTIKIYCLMKTGRYFEPVGQIGEHSFKEMWI